MSNAPAPLPTVNQQKALTVRSMVDDFRFAAEQNVHLGDTEEQDSHLKAHIKMGYESQGMTVLEATIEQDIQALREKKWDFHPPKLNPFEEKTVLAYISRHKWALKIFVSIFSLTFIFFGYKTFKVYADRQQIKHAEMSEKSMVDFILLAQENLDKVSKTLELLKENNTVFFANAAEQIDLEIQSQKIILSDIESTLPNWFDTTSLHEKDWTITLPKQKPLRLSEGVNWDKKHQRQWVDAFYGPRDNIQKVYTVTINLEIVLGILALTQSEEAQLAFNQFPHLRLDFEQALTSINLKDTKTVTNLMKSIAALLQENLLQKSAQNATKGIEKIG